MTESSPERGALVVKSTRAGLGDLIRGLVTGVALGRVSGRRVFVDWCDTLYTDSSDQDNLFSSLLKSDTVLPIEVLLREKGGTDCYPPIWEQGLELSVDELMLRKGITWDESRCRELMAVDTAGVQQNLNNCAITFGFKELESAILELRKFDKTASIASLCRSSIHPHNDIVKVAHDWAKTSKLDLSHAIGLHIRKTRESIDKSTNTSKAIKHVDEELARFPDSQIFLATDNSQVQNQLQDRYKGKIKCRNIWKPEPGAPIHLDIEAGSGLTIAVDAMTDIYLLSQCKTLVYNNRSSFGLVASWWSEGTSLDAGYARNSNISGTITSRAHSFVSRFKRKLN